MVLRNLVTTSHLLATKIRSWLRMILLTAATISGVKPMAKFCNFAVVASALSSQFLKSPTVKWEIGANKSARCSSIIKRVTSSLS